MHWPSLLALAALFQPSISWDGPYTEGAAERPGNVTGLHRQYYSSIGSYYNGTATIKIYPLRDPPRIYADYVVESYVCDEYENKTFEVEMNAMAGFKMPPPKWAPHVNPFFLDLRVWPKPYELHVPLADNYTWEQAFDFISETNTDRGPRWVFNMSTPSDTTDDSTSTTNTNIASYRFSGGASTNDTIWGQEFVFNVTDACETTSYGAEKLYEGYYLLPEDMDTGVSYDWVTDDLMRRPSVSGEFNEEVAVVRFSGTFSATLYQGSSHDSMVGRAEVTFTGRIDAERSDELLLGRRVPEWNATLGFGERDGVAGLGHGGSGKVGWSRGALGLAGLVGVLLLL